MPGGSWIYDPRSGRYRDRLTNRFLSRDNMIGLRDDFVSNLQSYADILANQLVAGDITETEWTEAMQETVGSAFIDQYALGVGGRSMLDEEGYQAISEMLDTQYSYLDAFVGQLADMTEAQIANRAGMYFSSSAQAYDNGVTDGLGMPPLDQVPRDGQTRCGSNCACELDIQPTDDGWDVFWKLDPSKENCIDCVELSDQWNPLEVSRE